jgi:hypothetical protein
LRSERAWSSAAACGCGAEACAARREERDIGALVGFTLAEAEVEAGMAEPDGVELAEADGVRCDGGVLA